MILMSKQFPTTPETVSKYKLNSILSDYNKYYPERKQGNDIHSMVILDNAWVYIDGFSYNYSENTGIVRTYLVL